MPRSSLYKKAGVDQGAADSLASWIGARLGRDSDIVLGVGAFAGAYTIPGTGGKRLLVACTDGVGTKLKVAFALGRHDTVGIDLVAMSVNDLITTGARPLFFLDYFGTGKLNEGVAKAVLEGILKGCRQAGCVLLGGETAQLPDFYARGEYDMAGFAVGLVDRKDVIDGRSVRPGDYVLGLPSSGLHSNGFTLVRRIVEETGRGLRARVRGLKRPLGEELLTPTRIYARDVAKLRDALPRGAVRAMAHITGGGLPGNVPRVLPKGCAARINKGSWPVPPVFRLVQEWGGISEGEMYEVFNMGIGMVAVIRGREGDLAAAVKALGKRKAILIGGVVEGDGGVEWQ